MPQNIVVIGCAGAMGRAFVNKLKQCYSNAVLHAFSSKNNAEKVPHVIYHKIDYRDEQSIATAAAIASQKELIDIVIIASGLLHHNNLMPEKSLKDVSSAKCHFFFEANTIIPALIIKHFSKRLCKENSAIIAALSARVGSISDNQLGGWYAYRASKAALNMMIKNAAIEMARTHKNAIIVGLHPGTVDSVLSKPFQKNVPVEKIFSPDFSAEKLIEVIQSLTTSQSGKCLAWDGSEVKP